MRKRTILLVVVLVAAFVVAGGVAWAETIGCPNRSGNLCVGTSARDVMTGTTGIDDMRGGGGNDEMRGLGGGDLMLGQLGNDSVAGQDGSDRLTGGAGTDALNGGATGNETYLFTNGWGEDRIADASGRDTLDFSALSANVAVNLVLSANNEASSGTNTLNFGATAVIENVSGGSANNINGTINDVLFGNTANNGLSGNGGNDFLKGYGGNDVLSGGANRDSLEGAAGNDTLNGGADSDSYVFEDGWGQDRITADASGFADELNFLNLTSPVVVDLAAADPGVEASSGGNTVNLPSVVDPEEVYGGTTDDVLRGSGLGDDLYGGSTDPSTPSGNDELEGRAGNGNLNGVTGDDTYIFDDGWGLDQLNEFSGNDTPDFSAVNSPLNVNLFEDIQANASGANEVTSGSDIVNWFAGRIVEKVKGGTAGDTITGYSANNDLTGGDGDDTINGGGGDDIIRANDGQGGDIIDCEANTTADPGDTVHIDARFTLNGVQDLDIDSNCETVQRHFPAFSP